LVNLGSAQQFKAVIKIEVGIATTSDIKLKTKLKDEQEMDYASVSQTPEFSQPKQIT
jgi:hypothetical protein